MITRKEAMALYESLVDQDTKFRREVNALFKQKECIELLQQAYDLSDDEAKMSLMDAVEKQFLDKFAKDGSGNDEKEEEKKDGDDDFGMDDGSDGFLEDGSALELDDDSSDDDGSDDGSDDDGAEPTATELDSNPFADYGSESNPFESMRPTGKGYRILNEDKTHRFIRRKK